MSINSSSDGRKQWVYVEFGSSDKALQKYLKTQWILYDFSESNFLHVLCTHGGLRLNSLFIWQVVIVNQQVETPDFLCLPHLHNKTTGFSFFLSLYVFCINTMIRRTTLGISESFLRQLVRLGSWRHCKNFCYALARSLEHRLSSV